VDPQEIIRRYAELQSREAAWWRTGDWRTKPRASLVREVEAVIRRRFFSLPEDQRGPALQRMGEMVEEVTATEADMDSVTLFIDWSRGRSSGKKVKCPCRPPAECPLLVKDVGWRPGQEPADRATPEELAQCPLQGSRELLLRVVATPKGNLKKWWQQTKRQPACGLVLHRDACGSGHRVVGTTDGRTVPKMMRQARSMLYNWRKAEGVDAEQQAEVILLTPFVVDKPSRP